MLRWHSAENAVTLKNPRQHIEYGDTSFVGLVLPIWSKYSEIDVFQGSINGRDHGQFKEEITTVQPSVAFNNGLELLSKDVAVKIIDKAAERSPFHANLPLLLLPDPSLTPRQQHCIVDGLKSGACNMTGLAVIGAGLGLICGGAAGAYVGTLIGGGSGAATGVAQAISTWNSNSFRRFAAKANEFLLRARYDGLSESTYTAFYRLCLESSLLSCAQPDLLRQIVDVCEREFGVTASERLRSTLAKYV